MKSADSNGRISLWLLAVPVAAWGLHFLSVYVIAAIYCAKAGSPEMAAGGPLTSVRLWVAVVTAAAVVAYALAARRGYAGIRSDSRDAQDQNFLGAVALMLCVLSAAASLFLASVPFFFGDCRP